jgi:hypothetical protein
MMTRISLVLLLACGCHPWSTTEVPAPNRSLPGDARQVRVVFKNGTSTVLTNPVIAVDTITGIKAMASTGAPIHVSIPTARIAALQIRKFSTVATSVLVLLVGAFAIGIAYVYVLSSPGY